MKYTVPAIPPSLNQFAGRKNDREYQRLKREWKDLVYCCCMPRPRAPLKRARVTLTYFFPTRARRDPDNYAGKLILDGMTAAGVIADDSFGCIELVLRGRHDKANPRTEITVEEITE